jgi:hypothetical protein
MISYLPWPRQLLGSYYELTTSTLYRTKLLHEYTIYNIMYQADPRILKYTSISRLSVNTYSSMHDINVRLWVHRNVT